MALPCPPEKAKNFGKTMKTLFSYLAPYKFRVAMVFLFARTQYGLYDNISYSAGSCHRQGGGGDNGGHGSRLWRSS